MAAASGIKGEDRERAIAGWLFMSPTILIFGVFIIIPILFAIYFSMTDWNGISPPRDATFIGLDNYQRILIQSGIRQSDFFKALKNTTYFALGVVPAQTLISLLLAVIVNQAWLRFKGFFRTTYYFPSITSSIAISLMFLFFYQKSGLINQVLSALTLGRWESIAWMSTARAVPHPAGRGRHHHPDRAGMGADPGAGPDHLGLDQRAEHRPDGDHDHEYLDDHRHDDGHLPGRATERARLRL